MRAMGLCEVSPGTRLGVYEITARIGEGGMGQVFRASPHCRHHGNANATNSAACC